MWPVSLEKEEIWTQTSKGKTTWRGTGRRWPLSAKEKGLESILSSQPQRNQPWWLLDVALLASGLRDHTFLVRKPPHLWYFVTRWMSIKHCPSFINTFFYINISVDGTTFCVLGQQKSRSHSQFLPCPFSLYPNHHLMFLKCLHLPSWPLLLGNLSHHSIFSGMLRGPSNWSICSHFCVCTIHFNNQLYLEHANNSCLFPWNLLWNLDYSGSPGLEWSLRPSFLLKHDSRDFCFRPHVVASTQQCPCLTLLEN